MLKSVERSEIFSEFTSEEKKYWFGIKEKAVSHHVDTLYYSLYLKDDDVNISHPGITALLEELRGNRSLKLVSPDANVTFYGLDVLSSGAAISGGMYMNHLQSPENFDIFISDYIPNKDTPRIQVQLRTRMLVLEGLHVAILKSHEILKEILFYYNIEIQKIVENRIDYAFHSNLIQKPIEMFGDESLQAHLITTFRENWKHLWITANRDSFFDLDYIALGSRRSNNVFFRAYEKSKEVVQLNYKGFFFEMWRKRGIISRYDQFVYEKAYELKSFKTGCLVGRIEWYLQYGHDEELKNKYRKLLESCYIKSDNNPHIEKKIKGVLPPVTVVLNVEFETKRKFYLKLSKFMDCYKYKCAHAPELHRLFKVLSLRREILDKLMSDTVSFKVSNRDPEGPDMDWWHRLRTVRIDDQPSKAVLRIFYDYSHNLDLRRSERAFSRNLATVSALHRKAASESMFSEDLWESLTNVNDNDLPEFYQGLLEGMKPNNYYEIQQRKRRQLKPLFIHSEEPKGKDSKGKDSKGKEPKYWDVHKIEERAVPKYWDDEKGKTTEYDKKDQTKIPDYALN